MKKFLACMMTATLTMIAFATPASAQDIPLEYARFDYDTDIQVGVGMLAGTVGVAVGGIGGLAFGASRCGGGLGCLGAGIIEGGVLGFVGGVGGSMLGVALTGGEQAQSENMVDAFWGGSLGALIGAPLGIGASLGIAVLGRGQYNVVGAIVGVSITGVAMGFGAANGYQSRYGLLEISEVELAPMITPEHAGMMISGRF